MSLFNKIENKISKIENLLNELKQDLDIIRIKVEKKSEKKHPKSEVMPNVEELKALYDELYDLFMHGKHDEIMIALNQKSKKFLTAFCRANNLPIDSSKSSKKKIAEEVINWLSQRMAITKEVR